ncbi:winged helix-turn-helix transcriptional regulator [Candidatus Woesearchaeota archaeon]|jgi:DNA-binding transcriptional ArsR family regulator|nr:winged helix-turn-helix transcriptional regulator [Candidatus Woesearchaeota archaeon]MBT5272941.1 winged helix-turn-helix transcriptional regulator [Candidatus Woesearchaeota archaeon]MBT6041407.1 winged helix-turn-helix transcriptional regulator [Candidatus Woesearchaeota archaeon]MBT6337290.1 winged helix-turn-helix transcriptional regulator [Candidatus Woesearchaeota archaeon]MBT7927167.1 winged helix-turn-helix transcriptional regulator [Candidatus Woesearchaeota archaeon]
MKQKPYNQDNACMAASSYKDFFVNFANKTKMDIVAVLRKKPLCVNEIVEAIGEEQSKVSHSLKKLTKCKILEVKQEGKKRVYSLNHKTVLPILQIVEKHVHTYCAKDCPLKCDGCNKK